MDQDRKNNLAKMMNDFENHKRNIKIVQQQQQPKYKPVDLTDSLSVGIGTITTEAVWRLKNKI